MTPAEIAEAISVPRNNVKQLLFKMTKAGEVRKVTRGRYRRPDREPPEPSAQNVTSLVDYRKAKWGDDDDDG